MKLAMFFIIIMSCFFMLFAVSSAIFVLFKLEDIDKIDSRISVLAFLQAILIVIMALIFAAIGVVNFIKYV